MSGDQKERLAVFLASCAGIASARPDAYGKRDLVDRFNRDLQRDFVGLHPADRLEAEATIRRLSGT